jgi:hypothetical protein
VDEQAEGGVMMIDDDDIERRLNDDIRVFKFYLLFVFLFPDIWMGLCWYGGIRWWLSGLLSFAFAWTATAYLVVWTDADDKNQ